MTKRDIDSIEAQLDVSTPHYLPTLIAEVRVLKAQLAARDAEVARLREERDDYKAGAAMEAKAADDARAALATLREAVQGWQDIATAPKDGTVILRPHRIWGAMDVRYAVDPPIVTALSAGTKWEWLNGDYTTAWSDDAFLPFWQPLPAPPVAADKAVTP